MDKLDNLKVGDKVVVVAEGTNQDRYYRGRPIEDRIREGVVAKNGRKYITVKMINDSEIQFDKTNNYTEKTNGCADYSLYANRQDIFDKFERESLEIDLRLAFDFSSSRKFSLDQLRRIKNIIDEK